MTTKVKFEFVSGNKAVEIVDEMTGQNFAMLNAPGRSVELNVYGDTKLTVRETGEFFDATSPPSVAVPPSTLGGEPGSSVPDERIDG